MDPDAFPPSGPPPWSLRERAWRRAMRVLVMAPHPDDFDAIGVTLRHLHLQGHELHVAVLTSGAGGVDDGFGGAHDTQAKASLREAEQRESCAFFGLPAQRLHFLRLWEGEAAQQDMPAPLVAWMAQRPADLVFMPHGNDSNRTHRRTYEAVCAIARRQGLRAWALLNQDAKTLGMRVDALFDYGEEEAQWKARLLRLHASQQERNLRARGAGFDARILELNRDAAGGLPTSLPYAEAFELVRLG